MTARLPVRSATLALGACTLAVTGAIVSGAPASAGHDGTTDLRTALTGAQEAPVRGDPDGSGRGRLRIEVETGEICFELRVRNIAEATAAHIHKAPRGAAGPVVAPLVAPDDERSQGCVTNTALAREIAAAPAAFYLNVHNADFPGGALRGQLSGHR